MIDPTQQENVENTEKNSFIDDIKRDYRIALESREASLLGRKEVLTGKAKFGILGDGKELPQLAMARAFRKGDWRAGYYRDQTFMMAIEECDLEAFFAQLYADVENDPWSSGRQMNNHFATPTVDSDGNWLSHTDRYNVAADISPTAGQMAKSLGLALASRKYRQIPELHNTQFSDDGNEVIFCTIGDASTSEGVFWEVMNAAAVEQVPLLCLVWDDGYGISVPTELQTVKGSISAALAGFETEDEEDNGILIYTVKAWDYPELISTMEDAAETVRNTHRPALVHVQEVTQPQGHSTSGSHERYKSKERLEWEAEFDGIKKMEAFMLLNGFITEEEIESMRAAAQERVKQAKDAAWAAFQAPIKAHLEAAKSLLLGMGDAPGAADGLREIGMLRNPSYHEYIKILDQVKIAHIASGQAVPDQIADLLDTGMRTAHDRYHTHLYSETDKRAIDAPIIPAQYSEDSKTINGYQVLNTFFDQKLANHPEIIAFGEDVGQIGDVNQGFAGLQEKYGDERVFDTGIREWSIMGSAIGTAMRGMRPIAEIQYLDYLIYGLSPLSDDLATLRYRTAGIQAAPAIIRTRGHRLEGIWHAGSPLGMILNTLNGMHVCVPRNMVQAAGMYNTLLRSDDPALIIECLNGYRLKEQLPDNLMEFTVPLGMPEVLKVGSDLTLVTYGSCVREAQKAIKYADQAGIDVELIDVQTLLPFDLEGIVLESLKKTNRILFVDEDVPSGGTAYMLNEVVSKQGGYQYLDAKPRCHSAHAHRTPFGSDGDYFTKPTGESIFHEILALIQE